MALYAAASTLVVGDVIQDQDATGDSHPFIVVERDQWNLTLRNCTSFPNDALTLVKVEKGDKTGDPVWSGKDSYVVKSGGTIGLSVYNDTSYPSGEYDEVEEVHPTPVQMMGPYGPCIAYIPQSVIMVYPRMVERYSEASYRKIGGVGSARMTTLLTEL